MKQMKSNDSVEQQSTLQKPIQKKGSVKAKQRPIQAKQRSVNKSNPEPRTIDPFYIKPKTEDVLVQQKPNNTGLPDNLKSGIESLSGYSMDDVKVHYNSDKPTQLQAHAYAQGSDIHIASGQEKHLPHEAWHVVQQKQGRVKPTRQMKGKVNINDDVGLEKEADMMGTKALQRKYTTPTQSFNVHSSKQLNQGKTLVTQRVKEKRVLRPRKEVRHNGYVVHSHKKGTRFQKDIKDRNPHAQTRRNPKIAPFKESQNGTKLWNGTKRPGWPPGFEDEFWAKQESKTENGKTLYKCKVSAKKTAYLPRKKDAKKREDTASIGHKVQWLDYLLRNVIYGQHKVKGGKIRAITFEDAQATYADPANLQAEGQAYNSSKAKQYKTDSMHQEWVDDEKKKKR